MKNTYLLYFYFSYALLTLLRITLEFVAEPQMIYDDRVSPKVSHYDSYVVMLT